MSGLRVFTFMSGWGLPTTGPFALKLLAWLGLNGISYEQVIENNPSKGPLGKSPWIELEGSRIGDSDAIIRLLAERHDIDLALGATPDDRAIAHAFKTTFEERFHQILEWELFVHPAGAAFINETIRSQTPPLIGAIISRSMRRHFANQLHARGIARHAPETIADMGKSDLDALAARLADRSFLTGDEPVLADLAIFGQVAPMFHWPMDTPVARYAKSVAVLRAWSDRIKARCQLVEESTLSSVQPASRSLDRASESIAMQ